MFKCLALDGCLLRTEIFIHLLPPCIFGWCHLIWLQTRVKDRRDMDRLQYLLQKMLKPSDVGNLGRIVLPKVRTCPFSFIDIRTRVGPVQACSERQELGALEEVLAFPGAPQSMHAGVSQPYIPALCHLFLFGLYSYLLCEWWEEKVGTSHSLSSTWMWFVIFTSRAYCAVVGPVLKYLPN